ncbi:hypothetical protein BDV12DRAFT_201233 [Aspergillus spectabilis]
MAGVLFTWALSKVFKEPRLIRVHLFEDLPVEIQLQVIDQLDRRDKLKLLRTSRYFYNLLQPQIYEHLYDIRNTPRLVDILVRRPSLCTHPRSLRLSAWDTPQTWAVDDNRNIDLDLLLMRYDISPVCIKAWEASFSEKEATAWERELKKMNPDAWIALLLTLLPNLFRLEIQFPDRSTYVLKVILRAAAGQFTMPVLQQLEQVSVSVGFEPYGLMTSFALPFFGLPGLRWLFTDSLSDGETGVVIGSSPVTHLAIGNCRGLQSLDELVKNCPQLESYRHGYFPYSTCDPDLNHLIYPALLNARHTLRKLWLDINRPREGSPVWPSFTEFTTLQLLQAPYFLLGDFDPDSTDTDAPDCLPKILPPTLETFHATGVDIPVISRLFPCLINYVQSPRVNLTNLTIALTTLSINLATIDTRAPGHSVRPGQILSNPVIDLATRLNGACCKTHVNLAVHEKRSRSLMEWAFEEPFSWSRTTVKMQAQDMYSESGN